MEKNLYPGCDLFALLTEGRIRCRFHILSDTADTSANCINYVCGLDLCRLVSRKYRVWCSPRRRWYSRGILVVNGRADVRREPRGRMNSLWKKRGCCTGDTDLRACASALQRALLRLTGVRAGFSFRRNAFSIAEEGNRAEKELPVRVKLHKCIAVGSKNQNFSYR